MGRFHERWVRSFTSLAAGAAVLLASGCNSFYRKWDKASREPIPQGIAGPWVGTWQSDASGHHDRLRCILSPQSNGVYAAQFQANYRKFLNFGYTVPLKVEQSGTQYHFTGDANLGWLAGGQYHYEGSANEKNFFSTYSCKYDHGTFHMARPNTVAATNLALTGGAPLAACTQMLLVTTHDWDAVPGTLRRYERASVSGTWHEVGEPIAIVVGKKGLGWGRGLNPPTGIPGPVKHEGDGKSPAGVFALSSAFGIGPKESASGLKMSYQPLTDVIECVDDVESVHYNSIVDNTRTGPPDWHSSEKMRAVGEQYRLGIVVDHNTDPRQAGGGSCIFIHIWKGDGTGTSGCTAMDARQIETLLPWLDPAAHPVLVQLPEAEYQHLRKVWQLPKS